VSWTEASDVEFDFCPICQELPGFCCCPERPSRRDRPRARGSQVRKERAPADDNGAPADVPPPAEPPVDEELPPPSARLAVVAAATPSLTDLYQPVDWHELWATTSAGPDWLVPEILERGRLHAIYAPKKHKKSLLTLLMVASLVTGQPLLGRPNPHGRPVRVLYIDIENSREDIRQRLQDAGYGPGDLSDLSYYSFPSLPGLDSAAGGTHLLALIERHQPELLVLDTTSRVVTGKENDADTFRSLYRHTLAPIKALGIAVLRLDNTGKDPTLGQRGSSAKGDDLDTAWLVTMHGEDRITLGLDFQRSNHHPARIELVRYLDPLRFVQLDDAADRPEVTALMGHLDRLNVPLDAGRPTAQAALRAEGIPATAAVLAEAIKIRKNRSTRSRTVVAEEGQTKIVSRCPDRNNDHRDSAAQSCSEQSANSSNSEPGSDNAGAVRDLPVQRSAQASHSTPQDCPTESPRDPQICTRCHYPTIRFVPPDGLCPSCEYPAGGAPEDDIKDH
jgi:hypothetical protein